jgi:predicted AAA+ superfamily ATPase
MPEFKTWKEAWIFIKSNLLENQKTYLFLDEVQRVPEFEKLVDGLHSRKELDIYITGSNAYLLSGELATFLSGRYIELKMQPLSFKEYCDALHVTGDYARHYMNYQQMSSFPYALALNNEKELIGDYLEGIYNSVIIKDVLSRKRLMDASLIDRLCHFLFDNIGNVTSLRNIANCINALGIKTCSTTIDSYLDALCDAFLFYKVQRYDVKGKAFLQSGYKYYAADIGLRYHKLGHRPGDSGHILENIIYLELLRRSSNVFIGCCGANEIDFITRDGADVHYYQVSETLRDDQTRKREFAPLLALKDHHPKTVITLDEDPKSNLDGVQQINVYDFLLNI